MSCHEIRSHINKLPPDEIFCTRDLLHLSSRANVDQTLFRLVGRGLIKRLARGVFVRDLIISPTPQAIAQSRATAFGKKVEPHAAELLKEAGLAGSFPNPTLAFWGRRGAFLFGPQNALEKFTLAESCARKIALAQSPCGSIMRSIWHLQKHNCSWRTICSLTNPMSVDQHRAYPSIVRLMPAWLSDYFYLIKIGRIKNEDDADLYWARFAKAPKAA